MEKPTPKLPAAQFANYLSVSAQRSSFYLAFGQVPPGQSNAIGVACLVTSAEDAKAMLGVLSQAIERYEESFGALPEPTISTKPAPAAKARTDPPRAKRS